MAMAANAKQSPATPDEIWAILRETALRQKENELRLEREIARREAAEAKWEAEETRRREEDARRWAEEARRREADAKREAAEAKRRQAEEARRQAEEAKREAEEARRQQKWDAMVELWNQADRKLKAAQSEVGGISNTFGEVVEHLLIPGIEERLGELGFRFDDTYPRRKIKDENGEVVAEIDLLLENSDAVVAVEVKAKPRRKDIDEQAKKLQALRGSLNRKNDRRRILGVMAGAVFGKEQKRIASEAGLYMIVQAGDTMRMEIPKGFKPREW